MSTATCTVVRFPSDKVPAALIPYLGLDDTRPEAIAALINQARTDADMTNSKCAYRRHRPGGRTLICSLFESAPRLEPIRFSHARNSAREQPSREHQQEVNHVRLFR